MKNNKGFSLVELIIVLAIMMILAGLSVVTFSAANGNKPQKSMDNFVSSVKYSKSLVKANDKDSCVAIMLCNDGYYYAFQGTASGDSQDALRSSFRSLKTSEVSHTANSISTAKNVRRNAPEYTLAELNSTPRSAAIYQQLEKRVSIFYNDSYGNTGYGTGSSSLNNNKTTTVTLYNATDVPKGTEITAGENNAVIIKYRKYDGSVLTGAGCYSFSKYGKKDIKCAIILEKATGVFHKEYQ